MKKIILTLIFVLSLVIPNIEVKAVDVSSEEELIAAIANGGDVNLTSDIEVTSPITITKDMSINGYDSSKYLVHYIYTSSDIDLITVESGNVNFVAVYLIAGWDGTYNSNSSPSTSYTEGVGTALVVNGGTVTVSTRASCFYGGKTVLEVNGGTFNVSENYSYYYGSNGIIVNGGEVNFEWKPYVSSTGDALTVNGGNVSINITGDSSSGPLILRSFEGSGIVANNNANVSIKGLIRKNNLNQIESYGGHAIEVNDGATVDLSYVDLIGGTNAIYLNGGTVNLSGFVALSSPEYGIYINQGINTSTGGDVLTFSSDYVFGYKENTTPDFSIYINPEIEELRITDEKEFITFNENKLTLYFCNTSFTLLPMSSTQEEKTEICMNLDSVLDGPIYSNEVGSCTEVYINNTLQNEIDSSCNTSETPTLVVNVPNTFASNLKVVGIGVVLIAIAGMTIYITMYKRKINK